MPKVFELHVYDATVRHYLDTKSQYPSYSERTIVCFKITNFIVKYQLKMEPFDLLSLLAKCQHDHHVDVLFPDHAPVVVNGEW